LPFSELTKSSGLKVKKLLSVNNCTMVLFDNGDVYGWGNNQEAILANNHIREYVYATGYYKPTPIHKNYNGNVVDFDISTNMFVMLTDTG